MSASPASLATDHELFVGDLIDQMRKQRQEKSRGYRRLPYFQHLGSEEVFEALDRVRQANLLQMQLKMQKDCSYLQHMDDMSLEGRNAESVRKRVQEGKLQGGFRQIQNHGQTTVCGCLDCQLRLGNKQYNSSFQYEQAKEALQQRVQRSKLNVLGASWHGKLALAMHLASEGVTALHVAVLRGEAELVRLLCSRGEFDMASTWSGATALDLAVARGFEDGGDVLLQHGVPLHHFQHESLTEAVDRGSMLLLKALLQQMGLRTHHGPFISDVASDVLNCTNSDGNTPLHLACLLPEREAAIKILVQQSAEANKENAEGLTALDCCVQASNRNAWRTLRHATGGQAKYRKYEAEQRSLRAAVAANCLFLVRSVHLRADDDRKGEKLRTDLGDILHLAVSTAGVTDDMVQYLVEQGADVNAVKDGMSVLDACLQHNLINESTLGRHARLTHFQDYTIFAAAQEGLCGLVRYLANTSRKGGKDGVNHREAGCMALHVASAKGYADVVKALLKANSNVHEHTDAGKTALDLACEELIGRTPEDPSCIALCQTVDALLSRGCKLKDFSDESQLLERVKEVVQKAAETSRREAQERKEKDEARLEARKQAKRRREESDEVLRQVEREIRSSVTEEEKKSEAYKESEKLAKKVVESREVLQASLKGEGEKLPEYLSSKYYQIRIDVLRRKMQERDQQIEEALKKMDFAEEDYLWFLRKKMRDLRLKHHPDKITDRTPTDDDYKFYERLTKAYDVLCTKEERDKYLEMSNHVEWLQQHGEEEEARLVEKAIYDMDTQKKAKPNEKKEEESAQPTKEHVERAKKKLQERREEETWEKAGEKIKALTLGTPNKCKAPVVMAQRFSDRLEQCWIDVEWVCKCATASAERIEYELRVQAIDKGAGNWEEVYNGWESSVTGSGPFPVGTYEFMVRARNSIGWGEWSDVTVVTLKDPKWEKQQRREAEQQVMREQAKSIQWDLQEILDEVEEMQSENKLTIHRASNLLFLLQAELKKARAVRSYLPRPQVFRDAEAAVKVLEQWRDRKEAFSEWKQSLSEMKSQLLNEGSGRADCDLGHFLNQDEQYFRSLCPEIRNLIVQTLLGIDARQVFRRLVPAQKDQILAALRRGIDLGRSALDGTEEAIREKKDRTIFTKHQMEQLQRLYDKFSGAQCRAEPATPTKGQGGTEDLPDRPVESPAVAREVTAPRSREGSCESRGFVDEVRSPKEKSEKRFRTVHVIGLPHREQVARDDLVAALRPFAEVDGARVGTTDALVRFTTPDEAKSALSALEQGCVALRRSILSGQWATSDSLTEEALLRASGKSPREKQPTPSPKAALNAGLPMQSQHQQLPTMPAMPPHIQQLPQMQAAPQRNPPGGSRQPQLQPVIQATQAPLPLAHQSQQRQPLSRESGYPTSPQLGGFAEASAEHVPAVQRISMNQLVNKDSNTNMFKCPLCSHLSWQPKVTMCCQKVFCGKCLDQWFQSSNITPCCNTAVPAGDGSTGGCGQQHVKKLDRTSQGVQAVLWRVYANIRVGCTHGCGWSGDVFSFEEHCGVCTADPSKSQMKSQQQQGVRPTQQSSAQWQQGWQQQGSRQPAKASSSAPRKPHDASDAIGGTFAVVWEHHATDESQLSLRVGDRVTVSQVAAHGWVYGRRATPGQGASEGWFPSFCLPEKKPPPPVSSPPPQAPPAGATKVACDYEASDASQLSVKGGELVHVRQRDPSGWTFVVKVRKQGAGKGGGWVPDWVLKHDS